MPVPLRNCWTWTTESRAPGQGRSLGGAVIGQRSGGRGGAAQSPRSQDYGSCCAPFQSATARRRAPARGTGRATKRTHARLTDQVALLASGSAAEARPDYFCRRECVVDDQFGPSYRARKALFAKGLRQGRLTVREIDSALPTGALSAAERWLLYYSLRAAQVEIIDEGTGAVDPGFGSEDSSRFPDG